MLDVSIACFHMRVIARFLDRENRRKADVRAFHQIDPMGSGLGLEKRCKLVSVIGPVCRVHLACTKIAGHAGLFHQLTVELRFNRAERDLAPVAAFIAAIEMRTARQHAHTALRGEIGHFAHTEEEAHQTGRAIDNGRVHHLSLARALPFKERSHDPERTIHRAAAKIADKVLRRGCGFTRAPDG